MEREDALRMLNDALSREYNSVSEYVLNSSPWTTPDDAAALKAFQEIRERQQQTARWLTTRMREDFGAGPTIRAFEHWKLDLNYLSVPYLSRFVAEHFEKVAAEYDGVLKDVAGDKVLTAIYARLRDEAKAHHALVASSVPKWTEQPREAAPGATELPDPNPPKR